MALFASVALSRSLEAKESSRVKTCFQPCESVLVTRRCALFCWICIELHNEIVLSWCHTKAQVCCYMKLAIESVKGNFRRKST